jgi:hypothetical protein
MLSGLLEQFARKYLNFWFYSSYASFRCIHPYVVLAVFLYLFFFKVYLTIFNDDRVRKLDTCP